MDAEVIRALIEAYELEGQILSHCPNSRLREACSLVFDTLESVLLLEPNFRKEYLK